MGLATIQKVSRSGNALIVIIPKKITKLLNLNYGDYISIDWGEIITKKSKPTRKKVNNIEVQEEEEDELPEI